MEESEKSLSMRLAEEGVENPVAYEAASKAERRRLEIERERIQSKSFGQTFVEETDFPRLIEVMMESAVKAFAAGQGVQQARQPTNVVRTPEPAQESSEEPSESIQRSPLSQEVDLDSDES
jgi:hypothetical protein